MEFCYKIVSLTKTINDISCVYKMLPIFSRLNRILKAAGNGVNDENTTDGCMRICRFRLIQ